MAHRGVHAHLLLDIGGDSFAAMQLTMSIEERYGIDVPVDEFVIDLPLTELFERLGAYIAEHAADGAGEGPAE